jgi:hypothetical protein
MAELVPILVKVFILHEFLLNDLLVVDFYCHILHHDVFIYIHGIEIAKLWRYLDNWRLILLKLWLWIAKVLKKLCQHSREAEYFNF